MTLLLTALALTLTSAHVLELSQKMSYSAELYSAVNTTLYRHFATVGAVYTVGSIVAALVLVYLVRRRRAALAWTVAGTICLLLAFGSWLRSTGKSPRPCEPRPIRCPPSGCGYAAGGNTAMQ